MKTSALLLALASAVPTAIAAQSASTGSIHGVAFDSLRMMPAVGASVFIPGLSQIAVTDGAGRFALTGIPAGRHFVEFTSKALDSLGLNGLGAMVEVNPGADLDANLSTPGFQAIWRAFCKESDAVADSGIVWGTVRDATTDQRLSGARAMFSWYDLQVASGKRVDQRVLSKEVRTDSTATYYACGLPTDISLHAHADGARATSGMIQYAIGRSRLARVDLLVSTEMISTAQTAQPTSAHAEKPRGSATLRGVVESDRARPLANAELMFASLDTTIRTGSDGRFTLTNLPSGTHDLEVVSIGFAPVRMAVELHPGAITEVNATMTASQLLAPVNVKARNNATADRTDFEIRRKAGFGYAFDEKNFAKAMDLATVLQGAVPGAAISRKHGGDLSITMQRISLHGPLDCTPIAWLDGRRYDLVEALRTPMENLRAVEIFPHPESAPAQYVGFQACGVVLVWTKFARW